MIPPTLATGSALGVLPVAAAGLGSTPLPGVGDVLRALAGRDASTGEDLGASGRLPEADTLSPELLAALTGPDTLDTNPGPLATVPPSELGIPGIVLDAYDRAAQRMATNSPGCGVSWPVLAAIGRIESNHARDGQVDVNGTTTSPILGPQLSGGPGVAAIRDSDGGRLDGDTTWDRAVGPMQFIPTTWARYAVDGNNDGVADPHNVYDSALAAALYLCAGGEDLRDRAALARAIFQYNHSESYVRTVLEWVDAYSTGVVRLLTAPGEGPLPALPPDGALAAPTSPVPPITAPTVPPTSSPTQPPTATPPATTAPTPAPPPTTTSEAPAPTTSSPPTSTSATSTCTTPTSTTTPTTTTPTDPNCPAEEPAPTPAAPSESTSSMAPA